MTNPLLFPHHTLAESGRTHTVAGIRDTFTKAADVHIAGGGTVYLFVLVSAAARAWVDTHVTGDREMLGAGLVVEHRYATDLAHGMQADGLAVEYQR